MPLMPSTGCRFKFIWKHRRSTKIFRAFFLPLLEEPPREQPSQFHPRPFKGMAVIFDSARRYELCGLLGRGGLGEVLLATDTQLDRKVAIKRLYQNPEATAETAAAAIREARVLASLLHPNVVAVFDIFEFLDDVLVVMEYVPGRTLQELGDYAPMNF